VIGLNELQALITLGRNRLVKQVISALVPFPVHWTMVSITGAKIELTDHIVILEEGTDIKVKTAAFRFDSESAVIDYGQDTLLMISTSEFAWEGGSSHPHNRIVSRAYRVLTKGPDQPQSKATNVKEKEQ